MDIARGGASSSVPRVVVASAAALLGMATLFLLTRLGPGGVTHGSASVAGAVVSLAAGLGLLGAGFTALLLRPGGGAGFAAASLAGSAWLATEWVGWQGGPPLVRSLAMLVEPMFAAAVLHLVLAAARVPLTRRVVRATIAVIYAVAAAVILGRALVRDPFRDPACWSNCRDNVFLVTSQPPLARLLDAALLVLAGGVGLALVAVGVASLASFTQAGRRASWPVLIPAVALGLGLAAHGAAHIGGRIDRPQDPLSSALFVLRASVTVALAAGVLWGVARAWRSRRSLARLVSQLGAVPAPGSLQLALAEATADPSLEVIYRPTEDGRPLDARGRPTNEPSRRRAVTPILRDGVEIAAVVHDRDTVDAEQLREAIGPAARLAIDNERLQADLLRQLDQLRASRTRVVERSDHERRLLERNLHDGAQQRLLALSFDLRLAAREAAGRDETTGEALAAAHAHALEAVAALRDLAHGIYPAILTESGLDAALWSLTDAAAIPVELETIPQRRLPTTVERTAFLVVVEAIDAAQAASVGHIKVGMVEHDELLVIQVDRVASASVHLQDRVGALGGRVHVEEGRLRAEIPCA